MSSKLPDRVAAVSPPAYAMAAGFIGILGAFMTSSNTASNILFGPLQSETAETLARLTQAEALASQGADGAIGNAIAPANVVLGTGTAGITGREGDVLRYTLIFVLISGALTAGVALVYFVAL